MIDPFHLEAYGQTTVNYNRDVEIFPVLNTMLNMIVGESPYKSPTDMGVNMAGNCIIDDDVCVEASKNEIIRRYYQGLVDLRKGLIDEEPITKIEMVMSQANITPEFRNCVLTCLEKAEKTAPPAGKPGALWKRCAAFCKAAHRFFDTLNRPASRPASSSAGR